MSSTLLFRSEKTIFLMQNKDIEEAKVLAKSFNRNLTLINTFVAFFNSDLAKVIAVATASSHFYDKQFSGLINKVSFRTAMIKTHVFPRDLRLMCQEKDAIWLTDNIAFYFVYPKYPLDLMANELIGLHPDDYDPNFTAQDKYWRD